MFKINQNFINEKARIFNNIRNIHFDTLDEAKVGLGTYITETKSSNIEADYYDDEVASGVYIYKSKYDPKVALRVYRDFYHYKYSGNRDEIMISELQNRQKDVKLTEFPTGVVTIENKVIGQEVPFYENYNTLLSFFKKNMYKKIPTHYYIEVLKIIKELYSVGIGYSDIHGKNLLVNNIDETIKLIDFDDAYVRFDENKKYNHESMISNFRWLISDLNEICNISFDESFNKVQTLEEIEESILENQYKLLK